MRLSKSRMLKIMIKLSKMELIKMKLSEIQIPANYPRTELPKDLMLGKSIEEQGQIDPIIIDSKNYLIAGRRRLAEMKRKNYRTVWVIKHGDVTEPDKRYMLSVIESLHKKDLNPIEKAMAFKSMREMLGVTSRRLSTILRISRTAIDYHIKLLQLPEETKEKLIAGKVKPYELETLLYKHRIKTHEQFLASSDETKYKSVISRLVSFKSDIAYGVYDKEQMVNIKNHVEEIVRILEQRLQELEQKE